jgi:hypothetical protein
MRRRFEKKTQQSARKSILKRIPLPEKLFPPRKTEGRSFLRIQDNRNPKKIEQKNVDLFVPPNKNNKVDLTFCLIQALVSRSCAAVVIVVLLY